MKLLPSPYRYIISIFPLHVNVYAKFDEIPFMTLKDIRKQNVADGRTT